MDGPETAIMRIFMLDGLSGLIEELEAAKQELEATLKKENVPNSECGERAELEKRMADIKMRIRKYDPKYYMKVNVNFSEKTPQVKYTHSLDSYDRRNIHRENFRRLSKTDRKALRQLKFPISSLRVFNRRV